jgi:hypothetical protein
MRMPVEMATARWIMAMMTARVLGSTCAVILARHAKAVTAHNCHDKVPRNAPRLYAVEETEPRRLVHVTVQMRLKCG